VFEQNTLPPTRPTDTSDIALRNTKRAVKKSENNWKAEVQDPFARISFFIFFHFSAHVLERKSARMPTGRENSA
jgi:hypothetical protein